MSTSHTCHILQNLLLSESTLERGTRYQYEVIFHPSKLQHDDMSTVSLVLLRSTSARQSWLTASISAPVSYVGSWLGHNEITNIPAQPESECSTLPATRKLQIPWPILPVERQSITMVKDSPKECNQGQSENLECEAARSPMRRNSPNHPRQMGSNQQQDNRSVDEHHFAALSSLPSHQISNSIEPVSTITEVTRNSTDLSTGDSRWNSTGTPMRRSRSLCRNFHQFRSPSISPKKIHRSRSRSPIRLDMSKCPPKLGWEKQKLPTRSKKSGGSWLTAWWFRHDTQGSSATPEAFVARLNAVQCDEKGSLKELLRLRVHLGAAGTPYISTFLSEAGLNTITKVLETIPVDSRYSYAIWMEYLKILRIILNTNDGLKAILTSTTSIAHICRIAKSSDNKSRALAFDLLAGMCVSSSAIHSQIFSSLTSASDNGGPGRFTWLSQIFTIDICRGKDFTAQAKDLVRAGLTLANSLTTMWSDVEDRIAVRQELFGSFTADLQSRLATIDQDIKIQIGIINDQVLRDKIEFQNVVLGHASSGKILHDVVDGDHGLEDPYYCAPISSQHAFGKQSNDSDLKHFRALSCSKVSPQPDQDLKTASLDQSSLDRQYHARTNTWNSLSSDRTNNCQDTSSLFARGLNNPAAVDPPSAQCDSDDLEISSVSIASADDFGVAVVQKSVSIEDDRPFTHSSLVIAPDFVQAEDSIENNDPEHNCASASQSAFFGETCSVRQENMISSPSGSIFGTSSIHSYSRLREARQVSSVAKVKSRDGTPVQLPHLIPSSGRDANDASPDLLCTQISSIDAPCAFVGSEMSPVSSACLLSVPSPSTLPPPLSSIHESSLGGFTIAMHESENANSDNIPIPPPLPPVLAVSTPQQLRKSMPLPLALQTNGRAPKSRKKLKPLLWQKVSKEKLSGSIWIDLKDNIDNKLHQELMLSDLDKFFTKEQTGSNGYGISPFAKNTTTGKITLINHQRAKNIEVMLARVKLSYAEIAACLLAMDDRELGSDDQLHIMLRTLPLKDDICVIEDFQGDPGLLGNAERYILEIKDVPRIEVRLAALLFRRSFDYDVAEIVPELESLEEACKELTSSKALQAFLALALTAGNILNGSTFRGNAEGFHLEALTKFGEVRSSAQAQSGATLLHYLVGLMSNMRETGPLNFRDELKHCAVAARGKSGAKDHEARI